MPFGATFATGGAIAGLGPDNVRAGREVLEDVAPLGIAGGLFVQCRLCRSGFCRLRRLFIQSRLGRFGFRLLHFAHAGDECFRPHHEFGLGRRGVEFARGLGDTPWHSREFVVKDCHGRLLGNRCERRTSTCAVCPFGLHPARRPRLWLGATHPSHRLRASRSRCSAGAELRVSDFRTS